MARTGTAYISPRCPIYDKCEFGILVVIYSTYGYKWGGLESQRGETDEFLGVIIQLKRKMGEDVGGI